MLQPEKLMREKSLRTESKILIFYIYLNIFKNNYEIVYMHLTVFITS